LRLGLGRNRSPEEGFTVGYQHPVEDDSVEPGVVGEVLEMSGVGDRDCRRRAERLALVLWLESSVTYSRASCGLNQSLAISQTLHEAGQIGSSELPLPKGHRARPRVECCTPRLTM